MPTPKATKVKPPSRLTDLQKTHSEYAQLRTSVANQQHQYEKAQQYRRHSGKSYSSEHPNGKRRENV